MESLRILHIENPAGVASQIVKGQRELGHQADVLLTWHFPSDYPIDFELYYDGSSLKTLRNMRKTVKLAKKYDVVHMHTGINWKRLDVVSIALRGVPLVVHYHGSETRQGYGMYYRNVLPRAKIVATPDLLRWHPDAKFIPNPFSSPLDNVPWTDPNPLRILHASNSRGLKGTDRILEAIEILKKRGADFEFRLVENIPHPQLINEMAASHIVIDWLSDERETGIAGIFGMISLEAMSLGKVSIAYLSEETKKAYPPSLPIISPLRPIAEALADTLKACCNNKQGLKEIGEKGKEYVEEHHSPKKIAARHLEVYRKILR